MIKHWIEFQYKSIILLCFPKSYLPPSQQIIVCHQRFACGPMVASSYMQPGLGKFQSEVCSVIINKVSSLISIPTANWQLKTNKTKKTNKQKDQQQCSDRVSRALLADRRIHIFVFGLLGLREVTVNFSFILYTIYCMFDFFKHGHFYYLF